MAFAPLPVIEMELLGATHADIGAYLLTIWGFRDEIVEAVAYHHDASGLRDDATLAHLTYVAAALASGCDAGGASLGRPIELDAGYLARVNLAGPVAAWRAANADAPSSNQPVPAFGVTQ